MVSLTYKRYYINIQDFFGIFIGVKKILYMVLNKEINQCFRNLYYVDSMLLVKTTVRNQDIYVFHQNKIFVYQKVN